MVNQLARLPGIGQKTAQRLAYYIVSLPQEDVHELAAAIWQGRKAIRYCSICGQLRRGGYLRHLRRAGTAERADLRGTRPAGRGGHRAHA